MDHGADNAEETGKMDERSNEAAGGGLQIGRPAS